MSIHLPWTTDGARRYDVRLRDPSGRVYTRTFRTRREAEAFEADRHAAERLDDRFLPKRDHDSGRGLV